MLVLRGWACVKPLYQVRYPVHSRTCPVFGTLTSQAISLVEPCQVPIQRGQTSVSHSLRSSRNHRSTDVADPIVSLDLICNVESVSVSRNSLTGTFPQAYVSWRDVHPDRPLSLHFEKNQISGTFPNEFCDPSGSNEDDYATDCSLLTCQCCSNC